MLAPEKIKALKQIQMATNFKYGFKGKLPRVNLGPCGPFAKAFFEIWNELFPEKVIICFLFERETRECIHCLIKLPDGNYFDGGSGVISYRNINKMIQDDLDIQEMIEFDEAELDRNAYGLNRTYVECNNYDNEFTKGIIKKSLSGEI